MIPRILELDRLTLVAPLGLRFCDFTSGAFVGDGLDVQAYPSGSPTTKVAALANRKGVYVLHHPVLRRAPGPHELEHDEVAQDFWDTVPPPRDFVIEVNDNERRFQPFQFTASVPAKGIYNWTGFPSSPLAASESIPLFSSPVRSVPAGMAVLRADLWDESKNAAASWAVLEASMNSRVIARGIADEKGRIALILPYPPPRAFAISSPPGFPLSSPPSASGLPLTEQVWPLQLRALYTPERPVSSPPNSFETKSELPELRFTLSQPEATIWANAERTEPLLEASLHYGQELVLKSKAATSPPSQLRQSVLFITPAVSPL
jgi:hypothetical protein